MRQYSQLTYTEMIKMQLYLEDGIRQEEIAIRLGRDKSTVSRFIHRNSEADGTFNADRAWKKVAERKHGANAHTRILDDSLLKKFILEKIETFWTPEQIAGRWKRGMAEPLSHETIYRYVYRHHPRLVKLYFRRRGKRYRNRRMEKIYGKKYGIRDMRMIESRPASVDERRELGHWEGDSIVGKIGKQIILTNAERKSGYLLAGKSPFKTALDVADVTEDLFEEIPDGLKVTLTLDQGKEFARHKAIEDKTRLTVCFCHKSSPWERGTNENTNGPLRWFIPKGTDLESVSEKDLCHYVDLLNNRPRKRLNFLTPAEVFLEEVRKKVALRSGI
jgi:IS30 family transposase